MRLVVVVAVVVVLALLGRVGGAEADQPSAWRCVEWRQPLSMGGKQAKADGSDLDAQAFEVPAGWEPRGITRDGAHSSILLCAAR